LAIFSFRSGPIAIGGEQRVYILQKVPTIHPSLPSKWGSPLTINCQLPPDSYREPTANCQLRFHYLRFMRKIEHLGIAVKDLEASNELFKKLLGSEHYKVETVEREGVSTSFFLIGDTKIELLESSREDTAISKFIDKRGEGVHHIAFAVDDIYAEMERLQGEGFQLLYPEPLPGADGKLICFLHPKTTNGVLVELCMDKPAD